MYTSSYYADITDVAAIGKYERAKVNPQGILINPVQYPVI
jgi:hypothetical protein